MRLFPSCIPCLLQMVITACRAGNASDDKIFSALKKALSYLSEIDYSQPAPDYSQPILEYVSQVLGEPDPFLEIKKRSNQIGIKLASELALPFLEKATSEKDRLIRALKISLAGNIVDYAILPDINADIETRLAQALDVKFARLELEDFLVQLDRSPKILFLCDNAGEIAFDKILIQELNKKAKEIIVAVKSGPALNDALLEDAIEVGLDKIDKVKVITTGQARMGLDFEKMGAELKQLWEEADIIIAKGQANFECLFDKGLGIYFLTLIKCAPLSRYLGVEKGSAIFARGETK